MSDTNPIINIPDSAVNLAKDVYDDAGKPVVSETGKLLGLLPRTINNLLASLQKWNIHKEYEIEETKKLLYKKLENKEPEELTSPEPYVAVPAIQAISYSMGSDELRNMYANLLARAMTKKDYSKVHPAFVEMIKQMSPLDAKMFNVINQSKKSGIPLVHLSILLDPDGIERISVTNNITGLDISEHSSQCESIDNLSRLGLIRISEDWYTDDNLYTKIFSSNEYIQCFETARPMVYKPTHKLSPLKGIAEITAFGRLFYNICVKDVD